MSIGKSFGDKAYHPNRRVDRDSFFNRAQPQMGGEVTHSQDTDEAPAQGIPRPEPSIETEGDYDTDYSDVQDAAYWRGVQKNINLGLPDDHDNPRPPHLKGEE